MPVIKCNILSEFKKFINVNRVSLNKMFNKILYACFVCGILGNKFPEVKIKQGILKGSFRTTWDGRKFSAFTGIPYATPPVGKFRFQPPVPAEPWNGVYDASKNPKICPQIDVYVNDYTAKGDEDCLYLNVYTPEHSSPPKNKLPVMFYIHGGGFMCGDSTPSLYGPDILLDKDIVLVTINYRLGALGFLTTGDEHVPGNNGLKDQNLALRWVKDNIAEFGGHPELITIFGQSAGGASVHFHVLSSLSRDLINGAISHSGSALASWAIAPKDEGVRNSKKLAQLLDCPTGTSQEMVECLRKIHPYDILRRDKEFYDWHYDPMMPFKPVIEPDIEGAFLTELPSEIIKSGKSAKIPYILGLTSEDGAFKSAAVYNDSKLVEELNANFSELAPKIFSYHETSKNPNHISKAIRKFYLEDRKIDVTTKEEVTQMFTDGWILDAVDAAVEMHRKYTKYPVYYFVFAYKGSEGFGKIFGDSEHDYGVCHGDELIYLFSKDALSENYNPKPSDERMNAIMTTLWTNFAKTGDPTPVTNNLIKTKWKAVTSKNLEYLLIKNDEELAMTEKLFWSRTQFWRNLVIDPKRMKIIDEL